MNQQHGDPIVPPPRRYPIARPPEGDTDARFTYGLILEVGRLIEKHGYPELSGSDFARLQEALFRFIYEEKQQP